MYESGIIPKAMCVHYWALGRTLLCITQYRSVIHVYNVHSDLSVEKSSNVHIGELGFMMFEYKSL